MQVPWSLNIVRVVRMVFCVYFTHLRREVESIVQFLERFLHLDFYISLRIGEVVATILIWTVVLRVHTLLRKE